MAVLSKLARYRDISRLGSGGMATVVLAEDTVLGRPVALKRMTTATDARGLSRFRREALVGASISHPNVVSIYDVITSDDGDIVIVMEYVRGETLRDALARETRLSGRQALPILEGVASGLDAIHARGIVHRDVKPANILLGTDRAAKLADLGIASVPDRTRITTAGTVLGSFSYMAPEQLEDAPATRAIDVYALAAVAFEALSGTKSRPETNPLAVAHAIATQPPPDLRQAWPEAPAAAAELLIRGMAREPERRPRSAGELIGQLRGALEPRRTAPIARTRPTRLMPAAAVAEPAAAAVAEPGRPDARRPARRAPSPPRPPTPRRRALLAEEPNRRSRSWLVAGVPLALVALAIALAVILNGSGGRSSPTTAKSPTAPRARSTATRSRSGQATHTAAASTSSSSGGAASGAASASTPTASTPALTSAPATGNPPAPGNPSPGAGTPTSAVETFYSLAASHQYPQAWALADPTFRNQLGGYQSFQSGQAGDRRIIFNDARVLNQTASSATVAVRTTSVRTDGTQHCAGTVQLVPSGSGGGWLLHMIAINCS